MYCILLNGFQPTLILSYQRCNTNCIKECVLMQLIMLIYNKRMRFKVKLDNVKRYRKRHFHVLLRDKKCQEIN